MSNNPEHPLEIYAESYEQMARTSMGMVSYSTVATDIRQNMMKVTQAVTSLVGKDLAVEELRIAAQEFVDRVEKGEVRSKHTYERFKDVLKTLLGSKPIPQVPSAVITKDNRIAFEAWAVKENTYDLSPAKWQIKSFRGVPWDGYQRPYRQERTVYTYEGFCAGLQAKPQEPMFWYCVNKVTGRMKFAHTKKEADDMLNEKTGHWQVTPLLAGNPLAVSLK